MSALRVPELEDGEHITSFLRRLEEYKMNLLAPKYDLLLAFINEWLGTNFKALSEFKKIEHSVMVKDPKHNRRILRKYTVKFSKVFKSTNFSVEEDTDSDDITDNYIIYVVTKLLSSIEYKLVTQKVEYTDKQKLFYSILKK